MKTWSAVSTRWLCINDCGFVTLVEQCLPNERGYTCVLHTQRRFNSVVSINSMQWVRRGGFSFVSFKKIKLCLRWLPIGYICNVELRSVRHSLHRQQQIVFTLNLWVAVQHDCGFERAVNESKVCESGDMFEFLILFYYWYRQWQQLRATWSSPVGHRMRMGYKSLSSKLWNLL